MAWTFLGDRVMSEARPPRAAPPEGCQPRPGEMGTRLLPSRRPAYLC